MVDEKDLLDLLRKNPGLRTMQLCDRLDQEISDVETALGPLLRSGAIRAEQVMAPNNRKATAFWIVEAIAPTASTKKLASAGSSEPAVSTATATVMAVEKRSTKVNIAIEFIRRQAEKKATTEQLHALLGLRNGEYPTQYLQSALNNGRLVKSGTIWSLGVAATQEPKQSAAPVKKVTPAVTSRSDASGVNIDQAHKRNSVVAVEIAPAALDAFLAAAATFEKAAVAFAEGIRSGAFIKVSGAH